MRKKILIGCLAAAMMCTLCACGDKKEETTTATTTATVETTVEASTEETETEVPAVDIDASEIDLDELLAGVNQDYSEMRSISMDADMAMSAEMPDEEGNSQESNMQFCIQMNSIGNNEVQHSTANIDMEADGETENQIMEIYSTVDETGIVTAYMSEDGTNWTKTTDGESTFDTKEMLKVFNKDSFTDVEINVSGSEILVTGKMTLPADGSSMLSLAGVDSSMMDEVPVLDVLMVFDATTKEWKTMEIQMNDPITIMGFMSLNNYTVSFINNGIVNEEIVIPEDVINNAVEASTDDMEDIEFDGDVVEEDSATEEVTSEE